MGSHPALSKPGKNTRCKVEKDAADEKKGDI